MKREFFVAALLGLTGLIVGVKHARGQDLVTLSGTVYHHVRPVRVEPDGVTWQHASGAVKLDFADCPETVRRAYHYDAAKATAYREAQAKARQQSDEQAQRDARDHAAHQQARNQAAVAQMTASQGTDAATVFRRALSPAASAATRETAARMQADLDKRAAEAASNPDTFKLIPVVPGALGPRPTNSFMDTPNSKELAASLHHAPTGASGNCVPGSLDSDRTFLGDQFYLPIYATRSYYEDVDRAAAFASGSPK